MLIACTLVRKDDADDNLLVIDLAAGCRSFREPITITTAKPVESSSWPFPLNPFASSARLP